MGYLVLQIVKVNGLYNVYLYNILKTIAPYTVYMLKIVATTNVYIQCSLLIVYLFHLSIFIVK